MSEPHDGLLQLHHQRAMLTLFSYLAELRESTTDQNIVVKSKWPWMGKVVCRCPISLYSRLCLFIRTLRFTVPEKNQQILAKLVYSLKIYKKAVHYTILACQPQQLRQEKDYLQTAKRKLSSLCKQLEKEAALPSKQQEELQTLLESFEENMRLGINLNTSLVWKEYRSGRLNAASLKNKLTDLITIIQARVDAIPANLKHALEQANAFLEQKGPKKTVKKGTTCLAPEPSLLFRFFILDQPRQEIEQLHSLSNRAAKIWNSLMEQDSSKIEERQKRDMLEIQDFFAEQIKKDRITHDILNGYAVTRQFCMPDHLRSSLKAVS